MFLGFDVGNTHTVIGAYRGHHLITNGAYTDRQKTADEYGILLHELFECAGLDMKRFHGGYLIGSSSLDDRT